MRSSWRGYPILAWSAAQPEPAAMLVIELRRKPTACVMSVIGGTGAGALMRDVVLLLLLVFLIPVASYASVRFGSIAYYRTRAEYDRVVNRLKPPNGERDAEKRP